MSLVFDKDKFKQACNKIPGLNYEENECWVKLLDGRKVRKKQGIYRCYDKNNIEYLVDKNWCIKK